MQANQLLRCGRCTARITTITTRAFTSCSKLRREEASYSLFDRTDNYVLDRIPEWELSAESPSWLEVPKLEQAPSQRLPPVKGTLPIPRGIISDRRTKYKATKKYLDQTAAAPKSQPEIDLTQDDAYLEVFKRQVSATRRESLREGMQSLFQRRVVESKTERSKRSAKRRDERWALAEPIPEDELLTQESVPKVVRDALVWTPKQKSLTDQQKLQSRAEYDQVVEQRMQRKMDAIHDLYLNAKDFIVTTDQLNKEIETVFGADDNPVIWEHLGFGTSPWKHGPPLGVNALVGSSATNWSSDYKLENEKARQRMNLIAASLTGGTIPPELEEK